MNEVARGLDLQPNRFCLLAALLGNYQLTEEELAESHGRLASRAGSAKVSSPLTPAHTSHTASPLAYTHLSHQITSHWLISHAFSPLLQIHLSHRPLLNVQSPLS